METRLTQTIGRLTYKHTSQVPLCRGGSFQHIVLIVNRFTVILILLKVLSSPFTLSFSRLLPLSPFRSFFISLTFSFPHFLSLPFSHYLLSTLSRHVLLVCLFVLCLCAFVVCAYTCICFVCTPIHIVLAEAQVVRAGK